MCKEKNPQTYSSTDYLYKMNEKLKNYIIVLKLLPPASTYCMNSEAAINLSNGIFRLQNTHRPFGTTAS